MKKKIVVFVSILLAGGSVIASPQPSPVILNVLSPPIIYPNEISGTNDILLINSRNNLVRLNYEKNTQIWENATSLNGCFFIPAIRLQPEIKKDRIYAFDKTGVTCYSLADGKIDYKYNDNSLTRYGTVGSDVIAVPCGNIIKFLDLHCVYINQYLLDSDITSIKGRFVISTRPDLFLIFTKSSIYCFEQNIKQRWSVKYDWPLKLATVGTRIIGNDIYFIDDKGFKSINIDTGKQNYVKQIPGGVKTGDMVPITDKTIDKSKAVLVSNSGQFYCFEATPEGKQLWTFPYSGTVSSCFFDGTLGLFVIVSPEQAQCRKISDGSLLLTETTLGPNPIFYFDNGELLFIGQDNGLIKCYNKDGKYQWQVYINLFGKLKAYAQLQKTVKKGFAVATERGAYFVSQ